ncbi:MAG: phosphoribosylformylglycinamidine cyclo-ligase [Defluviitaleaceae bacterium]|nr:phosphoribosylformylglycinamidine cyclo-ligase [Defluviitaleaceae bacterium]
MADAYKQAGVDIHAGYEAVSRIKKHVERTRIPGVIGGIGGFGGLFELTDFKNYDEPVLVSGTDSVGTKVMLAFALDRHDTVGIDAVAMCVNDIIVVGAKPLFFLDYIGHGKQNPAKMEAIVAGVCEGCVQSGCALIGGEMAEMPGVYKDDEYDIVGAAVGIVEKKKMLTGDNITAGDALIGLASSGVHSNGFSLIRKIIAEKGLDLRKTYENHKKPLGEILLTPTRIYSKSVLALCEKLSPKGMSNITGGGFIENIPRMFPAGLGAEVRAGSWDVPPIFTFLQKHGGISDAEMYNIFNMGVGLVVAISADEAEKAVELLRANGENATIIGRVVTGEGVSFV